MREMPSMRETPEMREMRETDVATISFEACVEHLGADLDGPCEGCGWLLEEHRASLAAVIRVPSRSHALRRAS